MAASLVVSVVWVASPVVLFGLGLALLSFGPHVELVTSAGQVHRAGVCWGHKLDGELYADAVNALLYHRRGRLPPRHD